MNEHTKGEWRIGDGGWTIFGPPNGKPAPAVIATMEQGASMGPLERRGNARLIAAAPDLLLACKWALIMCNAQGKDKSTLCFDGVVEFCLIDELRKVITKATGGDK